MRGRRGSDRVRERAWSKRTKWESGTRQHVKDHREEGAPEGTLQCDTLGMRSRIVVEEGIGASVALYVSVSGFCNMVDSKKRVKGWRTQEQMKKHNSNRNKRRREMSGEKNKPRGN